MNILLVNAEACRTPLADGSVNCAAFSPPYFGLRLYAGIQGRPWPKVVYAPMPGLPPLTVPAMRCALGNERAPEAFIGHLVLCCREVKRVLRDDGVAWCVVGDSHAGGNNRGGGVENASAKQRSNAGTIDLMAKRGHVPSGLKRGDLLGIPARLMFALQADGWICRNENVWHKVAPMPSSVFGTHWERHRIKVKSGRPPARQEHLPSEGQRESGLRGNAWSDVGNQPNAEWQDCPGCPRCEAHGGYILRRGSWRHTRAHETVLMLTKKMNYWADQEAVREPNVKPYDNSNRSSYDNGSTGGFNLETGEWTPKGDAGLPLNPAGRNPRDVLTADETEELWLAFLAWLETAGPGDVLTPRPESYGGDHYAVYPTSLISQLIKAGCPAQCCPVCGTGWAPVVERSDEVNPSAKRSRFDRGKTGTNGDGRVQEGERYVNNLVGYRPACSCGRSDSTPGIVFDPFVGSGSTLVEALRQGKRAIGADLSAEYLSKQARARLELDAWDAWHNGRDGKVEAALEGLPLFGGAL